ncbi:MAG TPA: pentapeptide repeat-containing protein [Anaerolineales bacterium]|nr:pentapeptide repeat-containing protein [Anaerolineales bacterium]
MMRQNRGGSGGGCLTVIGILLLLAAITAAGFGLLAGILTLTGNLDSGGISVMILFATPLWLYLLIGGLRDLGKKTGTMKWLRLVVAGLLAAAIAGITIPYSVYLGKCDQRLVAGGRLIGCNLSGHDLHGLDLHNANLTYANLSGANLAGANLQGVQFKQTDLTGVSGLSDESLAKFLSVQVEDLAQTTSLLQIQLESRTKLQQALAGACGGRGIDGARINPNDQSFHTVMVLDAKGASSSAWGDGLKGNGWEPMALRFTDLVACVGNQVKVEVESCDYSGGSTVVRNRYEVKVSLFTAATGQQLAQETIQGSDPEGCPSTITQGGSVINGGKVSNDNLSNWLARWVHPPAK